MAPGSATASPEQSRWYGPTRKRAASRTWRRSARRPKSLYSNRNGMDSMQDEKMQARTSAAGSGLRAVPRSLTKRVRDFVRRVWRPAASVVAVVLAMLILWHGINGKNGLMAWQQKRVEGRELHKEIISLQQENTLLSERIERLKSNQIGRAHV